MNSLQDLLNRWNPASGRVCLAPAEPTRPEAAFHLIPFLG